MTENPYAAPEAEATLTTVESEAEQLRRTHLRAEASIRSIGTLYLVSGILFGLSAIGATSDGLPANYEGVKRIGYLMGMFGAPFLLILVGWKLRKLSKPATFAAGVVSVLGLLAFPVGTLINLIVLYSLFSRKGRFVVTAPYKEVIRVTPHVRYRTSLITWILLAVLILLLIFAGFAAFSSG